MTSTDLNDLGYLRVAAASNSVNLGNAAANATTILTIARELASEQVAVGVFPELCISGYSVEDLFFSDTLLADAKTALATLAKDNPLPLMIVGVPFRLADGRLLNCAAVLGNKRLLGLVPKSTNPNHGEFYDLRWFINADQVNETVIDSELGQFHVRRDQLFGIGEALIGVEICEDLWSPSPPNTYACLAGADIIANLSASNELIAKADYRRDLVRMTSARCISGYVYAAASATESTKDVVYGGHSMIAENGQVLIESSRFGLANNSIVADIDIAHLRRDRTQNTSYRGAPRNRSYRVIGAEQKPPATIELKRAIDPHPFVPRDEHEVSARAEEILSIQATGLARRMQAAHTNNLVIGLSGGLDSTLAYLVCLDTLAKLGLPSENLHALTMPGPGTTTRTLDSACTLAKVTGAELQRIDIEPAVEQHLKDLAHAGDHDVVFENAQARERTQLLFNFANKIGGIVVGTGDLSELALGWCTYNADHMASYNVNASVPKTLIAYLVRWYGQHRADGKLIEVLQDVLATPISPELIPPEEGEISQKTEAIVGPYELHDFFLFHYLRHGSTPSKIYFLACRAFAEQYPAEEIKRWLGQFFRRFFSQQFKRTTLPPGPKVGSVSLSPRGDWRMPDEADVQHILAEVDNL